MILPSRWGDRAIWMMMETIGEIAGYFDSRRKVRHDASEAYRR